MVAYSAIKKMLFTSKQARLSTYLPIPYESIILYNIMYYNFHISHHRVVLKNTITVISNIVQNDIHYKGTYMFFNFRYLYNRTS